MHVGVPERGERQLDDRGHLGVVGHEGRPRGDRANERAQLEIADGDPHRVQRAGDAHVARWQPDLLPCLAQCCGLGPGIRRVHRTARQGNLAGVGAQVAVPNRERDNEVAVSVGVDREQGRRRPRRRELVTLESAPGNLPVGGSRQEPIVEGNRAFGRLDGMTQHVLPAGLLA